MFTSVHVHSAARQVTKSAALPFPRKIHALGRRPNPRAVEVEVQAWP